MAHDERPTEPIDDFTRRLIRRKAKQLIACAGFRADDYEDLVQQLVLKVVTSMAGFDPAKGHRNKFLTAVVERYAANLLRDRGAGLRDFRRLQSLRTLVESEDGRCIERAQVLPDNVHGTRLGRQPRGEQEQTELALDMAHVLERLPGRQRELARRLMAEQPIAEIARQWSTSRATVYGLVRGLRRRLESAGLRDYL